MFQKQVARFRCIAQRLQRKETVLSAWVEELECGNAFCRLGTLQSGRSFIQGGVCLYLKKKENATQRYYWKAKKK